MGELSRRQFVERGAIAAAGLAAAPLIGCSSDSDSGTGKRGGTLRVSFGDATTNDILDPARLITSFQVFAGGLLFDNLVSLDLAFKAKPALATDFSVNADATRWTFRLRDGVKFHDGRPLRAEDVRWSVARLLDTDLGSGATAIIAPYLKASGIRTPDPTTVVFELERPNAFLTTLLGGYFGRILPAETRDFKRPQGTGPFRLESYEQGSRLEVTRNPDYWQDGKPLLDGVRVAIIGEQSTKLQSVLSGGADACDAIEYSSVPLARGNQSVKLVSAQGGNFPILIAPAQLRDFRDPRLALALKHAMDRERIVKEVFFDQAKVSADVPTPPDDPLSPTFDPFPHDPERARALLKEIGREDFSMVLWTSQVSAGLVDTAVVFKEIAAEAGINVRVETKAPSSYYTLANTYERPFMDYWLRQHPAIFLPALFGTGGAWNGTQFSDPKYDELAARAVATTDESAQKQAFEDAHRRVNDLASCVIPCHGDRVWVTRKNVRNLDLNWSNVANVHDTTVG